MAEQEVKKPGMIEKVPQFAKEVRFEVEKVHWPSRKETRAATVVVVIFVAISAVFLTVLDLGYSWAINTIFDLVP